MVDGPNRAMIGRYYPSDMFLVEAEATKQYALATNEDNAAYLDEETPGGIIAPPVFGVVPAFRFLTAIVMDPELNAPPERSLHGEQDMRFLSPIRPGDVLVTEGAVVGIEERSTGHTIEIEALTKTTEGVERVRQTLTTFVRDPSRKGSGAKPAVDRGTPLAQAVMKVTPDQPHRYAEASGDHNRPHVDEAFAQSIGYRGVFLQGLCTMAFGSKAIIDELAGGQPSRLKRLRVRFSKVVYPGDVLTTSIWASAEGGYDYETRNQDGTLVIADGHAEVS